MYMYNILFIMSLYITPKFTCTRNKLRLGLYKRTNIISINFIRSLFVTTWIVLNLGKHKIVLVLIKVTEAYLSQEKHFLKFVKL